MWKMGAANLSNSIIYRGLKDTSVLFLTFICMMTSPSLATGWYKGSYTILTQMRWLQSQKLPVSGRWWQGCWRSTHDQIWAWQLTRPLWWTSEQSWSETMPASGLSCWAPSSASPTNTHYSTVTTLSFTSQTLLLKAQCLHNGLRRVGNVLMQVITVQVTLPLQVTFCLTSSALNFLFSHTPSRFCQTTEITSCFHKLISHIFRVQRLIVFPLHISSELPQSFYSVLLVFIF